MKRPHLVNFLSIKTKKHLAIKASVTMKDIESPAEALNELEKFKPRFPIQALRLLNAYRFDIKIVGLNDQRERIYSKTFESDGLGNFYLKIPLNSNISDISSLQIFEVRRHPGLEILLGTYLPIVINDENKIIICDFDKTLVDTRYSTTKEMYHSLTKPLECFPTVDKSVELIKGKIEDNYHPFILSASPHFYEEAMRDWLYQNQIYTAGIFLKDYREVFSFFEGALSPKDLKIQGIYKLNHLLDILLMTDIPDELVLMGDNFESDPIIYLSLAKLLSGTCAPRELWLELKKLDAFEMTRKQESQLLNKFYQLHNFITDKYKHSPVLELKIYIRKKVNELDFNAPSFFNEQKKLVELYQGRESAITKATSEH